MISQLVSSSPIPGFSLTVQSLLGILSLAVSLPFPCSCSLSKISRLKIIIIIIIIKKETGSFHFLSLGTFYVGSPGCLARKSDDSACLAAKATCICFS